ncbi:MAG TPA: histidine phosphatase family protein [Steroidobacteraceae bacterium]|nr:histidine phosphatase family protein [Steroidobacteraceae bacterium]
MALTASTKPARAGYVAAARVCTKGIAVVTKIILVRHGHVPGISPERFRGRADIELTERGVAEARKTADWIARFWQPTIVYTSPMKRCRDTGAPIATRCGVDAQVIDDLNDIDYGDWQWQTHEAVAAESPALYRRWRTNPQWMRFPHGESFQDLVARAADALRLAIDRHPADTIVMVGHESINRAILLQVLDQPLSAYWKLVQDPCAINEIAGVDESVKVVSLNEATHLRL